MTKSVTAAVEDTDAIYLTALLNLCRIWRHRPADLSMALHGAYMLGNTNNGKHNLVWSEIEFLFTFYGSYKS